MAAKGSVAKETLTNVIKDALGADFIGVQDKKIYVWADDGDNGRIQVAIAMTVPKVQIAAGGEESGSAAPTPTPVRTELDPADAAKVAALMESLGVTPSAT